MDDAQPQQTERDHSSTTKPSTNGKTADERQLEGSSDDDVILPTREGARKDRFGGLGGSMKSLTHFLEQDKADIKRRTRSLSCPELDELPKKEDQEEGYDPTAAGSSAVSGPSVIYGMLPLDFLDTNAKRCCCISNSTPRRTAACALPEVSIFADTLSNTASPG